MNNLFRQVLYIKANNAGVNLEDDGGNISDIFTSATQLQLSVDPSNAVASSDIVFKVDGDEKVRIDENGYIGINDGIPDTAISIVGDDQLSSTITNKRYSNNPSPAYYDMMKARGTILAPLAVQSGDDLGRIWFRGYTGTGFSARLEILGETAENWDDSNQGTRFAIRATPIGGTSMTEVFSVNGDGQAKVKGSLVIPKTSGNAIKVDTTTPTFAWKDMIGEITVKGVGAKNPSWSAYRSPIFGYEFSSNDECWLEFHVPHDYAEGTDLFIHTHWSHTSASVASGGVTWTFSISYAKGYDQASFIAPVVPTVTQAASTTQYQHMIAEVQISAASPTASQIDTDDIEIDGLILVHVELTGNTISASTNPFLHFVDIHYQSTNIGTKSKSPDFYT